MNYQMYTYIRFMRRNVVSYDNHYSSIKFGSKFLRGACMPLVKLFWSLVTYQLNEGQFSRNPARNILLEHANRLILSRPIIPDIEWPAEGVGDRGGEKGEKGGTVSRSGGMIIKDRREKMWKKKEGERKSEADNIMLGASLSCILRAACRGG